jgi:hypothetical protein
MPRNRLPRVMKHYSPTGRRKYGRPLKRILDTWDRNRSTSAPTPWKICDDDDVDNDDDNDSRAVYVCWKTVCFAWMFCAGRRFVLVLANQWNCGVQLNIISGCRLCHSVKKVIVATFRDVHWRCKQQLLMEVWRAI